MDAKISEWNDERKVARLWVGYMWKGAGCLVLPWLQNHIHGIGINYCKITVYVSNSQLDTRLVLLISE